MAFWSWHKCALQEIPLDTHSRKIVANCTLTVKAIWLNLMIPYIKPTLVVQVEWQEATISILYYAESKCLLQESKGFGAIAMGRQERHL